jgi:hypothetical protein
MKIISLRNNLNSQFLFFLNLNIRDIPLINTMLVKEEKAPDVSNIRIIDSPEYNLDGYYNVKVMNDKPIYCLWKISNSITDVTKDDIEYCSDNSICGGISINFIINEIRPKSITKSIPGKYNLNMICYNDIPNPTLSSDVITLTTFNSWESSPDPIITYPKYDPDYYNINN